MRFSPNGIYHPSCEAFTVTLRHKVKQIRRVQSLYRRLYRWEQDHTTDPYSDDTSRAKQIQQEWGAILQAAGYPPSFLEWLHNTVEDYTLQPSSASLTHIADALIADCKEEEARTKKKQEKYRVAVYQDVRQHKSFCYKLIRPTSAPPMTGVEVQRTIRLEFSHLAEGGHQVFTTPDVAQLDTGQSLQVGRQSTTFRMKGPDSDMIEFPKPIPDDTTSATQTATLQQPSEVTEHIAGFWNQYWQRDDAEAHPDEEALNYVERYIPQHADLGIPHWLPHQWEAYQRKLKPTSAWGWCGFGPEDVKLVVWALLHLLSLLMATWTRWPEALRTAKTVMLPKVSQGCTPAQTRPITVFSILYRMWASANARKVLAQLGRRLPPMVTGGIPRHSTYMVITGIQTSIEQALLREGERSGMVLDIIKAFNLHPRRLLVSALKRFGVPAWLVDQWGLFLQQLQRSIVVGGHYSPLHSSTTGVPEGDALSILAMAMIGLIFHNLVQEMGAEAYTYADNLEWVTDDFSANRALATAVLQFLDAWRLPISPSKCWCWATTPYLRKQWTELWKELFPNQEAQVHVVAKDLGFEVLYGAQLRHATLHMRFNAAYDKLHRMAKLPISIHHKASECATDGTARNDRHIHRSATLQQITGRDIASGPWQTRPRLALVGVCAGRSGQH